MTKQTFVDLAKDCENGKEFHNKARKIYYVPDRISKWFADSYKAQDTIKACNQFVIDVKNNEVKGI